MINIQIQNSEHFLKVMEFARRTKQLAQLNEQFNRFMIRAANRMESVRQAYGDEVANESKSIILITPDFAPYSFFWQVSVELPKMYKTNEKYNESGEYTVHKWRANIEAYIPAKTVQGMHGGLIYHGPHDGFGDGGSPSYSVTLGKYKGWSIHT